MPPETYQFGRTPTAAERLQLLHEIFAPAGALFLADYAPRRPRLALDLGCGIGATTRLLAEQTGAARVVGIDLSEDFLHQARRSAPRGVEFVRHDVTEIPLPAAPADLIYCRFLLTHLGDVPGALAAWATQLAGAGCLIVEETEAIDTDVPVFVRYLGAVERLLAAAGQSLHAGVLLGRLPPDPALRIRAGRIARVPVATSRAAHLFALNLATWQHQPLSQAILGPAEATELGDALHRLAAAGDPTPRITWRIRQIAYERAPGTP